MSYPTKHGYGDIGTRWGGVNASNTWRINDDFFKKKILAPLPIASPKFIMNLKAK